MKLMNNAGAEVFFNLNNSEEYATMLADDVELITSRSAQPHIINYHNGVEQIEYELDPTASYSFEWEGETLMLLEVQG